MTYDIKENECTSCDLLSICDSSVYIKGGVICIIDGSGLLKNVTVNSEGCVIGKGSQNVTVADNCKRVTLNGAVYNCIIGQNSSDVLIGKGSQNITLEQNCKNISIGQYSGNGGLIQINQNVSNVSLPANTASNGQVIIEDGCGSNNGSLSVDQNCANGTVFKVSQNSFCGGDIVVHGQGMEHDDIFITGVQNGTFEK